VAEKTSPRKKPAARPGANGSEVLERLTRAIPRPHIELAFGDPWQLLVAVILSAQSTDRRVNEVTPQLFRRWPTPSLLAAAPSEEVEEVIKSTGFFRNKTKAIRSAGALIAERFAGQVPQSMSELLEVPGVARKTANVVLGGAYGVVSGIAADTHVMRVARRLALTTAETPEKIEADLCEIFPRDAWLGIGRRLVLHGRYVCTARAPDCPACPLNELCPARLASPLGTWQERAANEAADMEPRASGFARL
jgi:endonuclease III